MPAKKKSDRSRASKSHSAMPRASSQRPARAKLGASHLLPPDWPHTHPFILVRSQARQWTRPVPETQKKVMAAAAITSFAQAHADELGLPRELHRYGLSYIKAGAYSQIRRLIVDGEPSSWMMELPVDLDSRKLVIQENHVNFRHFHEAGRNRFLPRPAHLHQQPPTVPDAEDGYTVSIHSFFEGFEELNFGQGTLRRWDVSNKEEPMIPLPAEEVPGVLAGMIAILVYHFELEADHPEQGAALGDLHVNSGDFIYRPRPDGNYELKLITARRRVPGMPLPVFVQSLIQLATAEEMVPDRNKISSALSFHAELPVLISNPSIALHGIRRGLTELYEDLGRSAGEAEAETGRWLDCFALSQEGAPYQPWVTRFMSGKLPLTFGNDPREGQPDRELMRAIYSQFSALQASPHNSQDDQALQASLGYLQERLSQSSKEASE